MDERMQLFEFALKCHQAGFSKHKFAETLRLLNYLTKIDGSDIPSSEGKLLLDYFNFIGFVQ